MGALMSSLNDMRALKQQGKLGTDTDRPLQPGWRLFPRSAVWHRPYKSSISFQLSPLELSNDRSLTQAPENILLPNGSFRHVTECISDRCIDTHNLHDGDQPLNTNNFFLPESKQDLMLMADQNLSMHSAVFIEPVRMAYIIDQSFTTQALCAYPRRR